MGNKEEGKKVERIRGRGKRRGVKGREEEGSRGG